MNNLDKLRKLMMENNIDTYIISKLDPHNSETAPSYYNGVKFITGFTGSNGLVVVTQDAACLWTDGRYYIQAAKEIHGTEFILQKENTPQYPDFITYIFDNTVHDGTVAFDGRTFMKTKIDSLIKKISYKKIKLSFEKDFINEIWENRPRLSENKIFEHEEVFAGKSRNEKIKEVQSAMIKKNIENYLITSLDDIAWLYNLRGSDVDTNTTFASYCLIKQNGSVLFTNLEKASSIKDLLKDDNCLIYDYNKIFDYLSKLSQDEVLGVNLNNLNYLLCKSIKDYNILNLDVDITSELKSIKNKVEIENIRKVNIRDGVHLLKSVKWIKENVGKIKMTEYDVGKKVSHFRSLDEHYFSDSFDAIVAFGSNAAIMHYKADELASEEILTNNFLLIDSGGQYYDGTTDVTRTIVLGKITDEMKRHFTLVLKSNIALARAIFLENTPGIQLDIYARKIMWDNCMDYKSGTGHGIGYFLNVHEGPMSISGRNNFNPIKLGMVFSNEPGVYREGLYGIRTETTVLVVEKEKTEYGNFYELDTVTYFPMDLDGIDNNLLDEDEIVWINNYHKEVYKKLSPYLNDEEKEFLKKETRELKK